jgi:hypothetical protein
MRWRSGPRYLRAGCFALAARPACSWTRLDARLQAAQMEAGSDIYGASFFDWWEKR